MPNFNLLLRYLRPILLLFVMLTYGLGLGISRYLGATLLPEPQFVGGLILVLLLAASSLLTDYFRPAGQPLPIEIPRARQQFRSLLLTVSYTLLAVAGGLAVLLYLQGLLPLTAGLVLVGFFLVSLAIAVPPLRLQETGFGEIALSFNLTVLAPAFAFLLHTGSPHRFLTVFTLPLFLLALAYFLALDFPNFNENLKLNRHTLLMRLTWQRAIPTHNGLLLSAYLFLSAAPFLGVPFALIWPGLLTLPLAAYQVFMLRNIAEGARPVWNALIVVATALFGVTAYLLTLTFWLR